MSLQVPQVWEYRLLAWAEEALNTQSPTTALQADSELLAAAYHHCETVTQVNSRTFYMASGLLPDEKRRAARALYAFCRVTDNIVDSTAPVSERRTALAKWRRIITQDVPPQGELVALAWADAQQRFNIPRGYGQQLIDGVARDLTDDRYQSFGDIAEYSYGVASTVGLMAMHIIGFAGEQALPYAIKLGVALQMTNILRDIAEDWQYSRVYLPQDDLTMFNLTEQDIATGRVTDNWRAFMHFQIDRTRRLYEESWDGIALLDANGRFAIRAAAELYLGILQDIENHDYDVFSRRAHITLPGKLRRLPGIWWRSRQG